MSRLTLLIITWISSSCFACDLERYQLKYRFKSGKNSLLKNGPIEVTEKSN